MGINFNKKYSIFYIFNNINSENYKYNKYNNNNWPFDNKGFQERDNNQNTSSHTIKVSFKPLKGVTAEFGINYNKYDNNFYYQYQNSSSTNDNIERFSENTREYSSFSDLEALIKSQDEKIPFKEFNFSIIAKAELIQNWPFTIGINGGSFRKYNNNWQYQQRVNKNYYTKGTNVGKESYYSSSEENHYLDLNHFHQYNGFLRAEYYKKIKNITLGFTPEFHGKMQALSINSYNERASISKYDSNTNGMFENSEISESQYTSKTNANERKNYNYNFMLNLGLKHKIVKSFELRYGFTYSINYEYIHYFMENENPYETENIFTFSTRKKFHLGFGFYMINNLIIDLYFNTNLFENLALDNDIAIQANYYF